MDHSPYTVNDVMATTVVAVALNVQFKEIVATMEKWKASALPVREGEGRVVGVVSEADPLTRDRTTRQRSSADEPANERGGGRLCRRRRTTRAVSSAAAADRVLGPTSCPTVGGYRKGPSGDSYAPGVKPSIAGAGQSPT
jgi:CBS-domain-containing membrane protein